MFKACQFSKTIIQSMESITGLYSKNWPIDVIDDDFIESVIVSALSITRAHVSAIIKVYSEKELNVALALTLYFKIINDHKIWSIADQIKFYEKEVPEFKKYS